MEPKNSSFILFTKINEVVKELTNEQKGLLFQAILDYQATGIVPEMDILIKLVFLPIKHDMDYCAEQREESIRKKSEAGKKSAEVRAAKANGKKQKATPLNTVEQCSAPLNTGQHNVNVNIDVNDKDIKTISTERSAPLPAVISLPLNDGTLYPITQSDIDKWTELYPAVNVISELRKMVGWLDANKDRRKTRKGVLRFVVNWLSGQQDKSQQKGAQTVKTTRFANFTGRDTDIEAETMELSRKVLGI
jgi:hypothetical protein